MKIVPSVIRKEQLGRRYAYPNDPYNLALLFCMDLAELGQHDSADTCRLRSQGWK
jgi:hypothetical protein